MRISSNFSPARNVRSFTRPVRTSRTLVRTNAPPLPGFTCWNSMIRLGLPSMLMHLPFLKSAVEIAISVFLSNVVLSR